MNGGYVVRPTYRQLSYVYPGRRQRNCRGRLRSDPRPRSQSPDHGSAERRRSAKIGSILARGPKAAEISRRALSSGRAGVGVLLITLLVLVGSACGGTHPLPAALSDAPVAPPKVGVDQHISFRAWWRVSKISRTGDVTFRARLSPSTGAANNQSRYVEMTGIGFPELGSQERHSYAGPGVDRAWEFQNNEYDVTFQFTGNRLGLSVLSTGGQWRALVNGALFGGGAPRSAGSSYAYHVLDLDFPADGARSRTITFQLNGGAWLAGIGTGAASDRVSLPARSQQSRPSVYWLGDSYAAGSGARYPGFDDLVHVASRQAGLTNVTIDALGGTGYLKTNAIAKFPNYLTRARLNLRAGRATPDLVVVGGSINDYPYTEHQVRSAATALYRYLGKALPRAKVVVIPFTDAYPVPSSIQHAIDGVLAAARSAPNVVGVLNLPARVLAHRGSQPVARLSATLASSTVKFHPSPAAHELYGRVIGRFLANVVRQQHL